MIVAPESRIFTALRRRSFNAEIDNLRPSIRSILHWMKFTADSFIV
jgi:hypothetical protein